MNKKSKICLKYLLKKKTLLKKNLLYTFILGTRYSLFFKWKSSTSKIRRRSRSMHWKLYKTRNLDLDHSNSQAQINLISIYISVSSIVFYSRRIWQFLHSCRCIIFWLVPQIFPKCKHSFAIKISYNFSIFSFLNQVLILLYFLI